MSILPRLSRLARFTLQALFWPWNLVLSCLAIFGYLPFALLDLVVDAVDGLARWDFVAGSVVMVAVPPATLVYAWLHRAHFKEAPGELAVLFFGVELPLLACTAARLFGFQELTGAAQLVYLALVAGGVVAEGRLIAGKRLPPVQLVDGVAHGLLVLRALAGAYVGFLLASISLPVLAQGLVEVAIGVADEPGILFGALVMFPVTAFVVATGLLVLTLPVTAPLTWFYALRRSGRALRAAWGLDDLLFASAAPALVGVVCLVVLVPQPHVAAFRALDALPKNDDERRALVAQRDEIALGLVDAYLGKHRYLTDDVNDTWARLWSFDGDLIAKSELRPLDEALNQLARPFTYEGHMPESKRAAQLYRDFFGHELERDHAAAVRNALAATWSQEERFAGFINEGQARVRLASQEVNAQPHDGVVDVEVHDVWVNQTGRDEEVALFFELPESAAVTGLWLSPTTRKEDGAKFVVAPRGAAQQIYNEEVRAHRDPALLEQVGPRQYRLRVFPVPARPPRDKSSVALSSSSWAGPEAPRVHVWMSYQALPDVDGRTPLPRLRERRNGFWDHQSTRTLNGASVDAIDAVDGGGWVQGEPSEHLDPQVVVADVDGACLKLTPAALPAPRLAGQRIDVVIDRSLDLAAHRAALGQALTALSASGASLRFVLGTSALRGESASVADVVNVDDLVFFGAARPKDLLRQLLALRGAEIGDAVVLLAGSASFDAADDSPLVLTSLGRALPPTFLVHVVGTMPAGYDDATIDALRRSGGNATTDIGQALARLSQRSSGPSAPAFVDGYRVDIDGLCPSATGALALAARQRILAADREGLAPLDTLDRLHRIAVNAGVVTPYSSMIVLLNDQQRARLAQLNQQQDRFDREVEADTKAGALLGDKDSTKSEVAPASEANEKKEVSKPQAVDEPTKAVAAPSVADPGMPMTGDDATKISLAPVINAQPATTTPPDVSGVPEPGEWLLMILAGIVVVVLERRRRLS